MIKDGSSYLFSVPTYALAPVGVVILLVVGYTMVADALNQSVLRE
jgi:ABC-type dipeptide/oligopeptide/nickel transport system permease subunit